jgi:hypothetical protein
MQTQDRATWLHFLTAKQAQKETMGISIRSKHIVQYNMLSCKKMMPSQEGGNLSEILTWNRNTYSRWGDKGDHITFGRLIFTNFLTCNANDNIVSNFK